MAGLDSIWVSEMSSERDALVPDIERAMAERAKEGTASLQVLISWFPMLNGKLSIDVEVMDHNVPEVLVQDIAAELRKIADQLWPETLGVNFQRHLG